VSGRGLWDRLREEITIERGRYDAQANEYGAPSSEPVAGHRKTIGERCRGRADMCDDLLVHMEVIESDYAQEVTELLSLLEATEGRITPEHIAQRFRELLNGLTATGNEERNSE